MTRADPFAFLVDATAPPGDSAGIATVDDTSYSLKLAMLRLDVEERLRASVAAPRVRYGDSRHDGDPTATGRYLPALRARPPEA